MLTTTLEHEGGDLSEKLTLAYAHSLMAYPTTWHVAAAYLAWCPCHGAEAMQQLLSQMPMKVSKLTASVCCHNITPLILSISAESDAVTQLSF